MKGLLEEGSGVMFVSTSPLAFHSSFRRIDWSIVNADVSGVLETEKTATIGLTSPHSTYVSIITQPSLHTSLVLVVRKP